MKIEIVVDTKEIWENVKYRLWKAKIFLKTKLGLKNEGYHKTFEESEFNQECPRCSSQSIAHVRNQSCSGLATAKVYKCRDCGQNFSVMPDYDTW